MQNAKSEIQSPEKDAPHDTQEKAPAEPQPKANSTDAVWTEEMMQWAIASSTCGGLPHKEDQDDKNADQAAAKETKDSQEDKPVCP